MLRPYDSSTKLLDVGDVEYAYIDEVSRNRSRRGHHRADQMCTAVLALAPLEIAVAGAGAALMRRQNVRVHSDAHAATGVAPLETGSGKHLVEAFLLGLRFDASRTRHNQR